MLWLLSGQDNTCRGLRCSAPSLRESTVSLEGESVQAGRLDENVRCGCKHTSEGFGSAEQELLWGGNLLRENSISQSEMNFARRFCSGRAELRSSFYFSENKSKNKSKNKKIS